MAKYRKKPVVIEAFKFYVDNMPDWFFDKVGTDDVILRNCDYKRYNIDQAYCEIKTLEGIMIGKGGDYIIKGVNGEIYPCKPDIFYKTYEPAGNKSFMSVEVNLADMPEFKTLINSLGKILTDERIPEEIRIEHYNQCNDALEKFNIKN